MYRSSIASTFLSSLSGHRSQERVDKILGQRTTLFVRLVYATHHLYSPLNIVLISIHESSYFGPTNDVIDKEYFYKVNEGQLCLIVPYPTFVYIHSSMK